MQGESLKAKGQKITPVAFRSRGGAGPKPLQEMVKWGAVAALCLILSGLVAGAWFVLTARKVVIDIEPVPDRVTIAGGLAAPRVGEHFLLRPGSYILRADKPCYVSLETPLTVGEEKNPVFKFTMPTLPGKLSLRLNDKDSPGQTIENARIFIDGQAVDPTPAQALEVQAGQRRVSVQAAGYRDYEGDMVIEGCGKLQEIDLAMTPGGAYIAISSVPMGASIDVDGQPAGKTPMRMALTEGPHEIVVTADGFKPWRKKLEVVSGEHREFKDIQLAPADGWLVVASTPGGARVMVGERYVGQTPLEAPVSPGVAHTVHLTKAGYEKSTRSIQVASAEKKAITVSLTPVMGIVQFTVVPDGAELLINGKSRGKIPRELRLIAVSHKIEIRKQGYLAFQSQVTPRPGFPQELKVLLKSAVAAKSTSAPETALPGMLSAPNGYALKRIQPGPFTMGSSRREQGRRSNETLRKIDLSRPFYMGVNEVANREFSEFEAQHNSGNIRAHSLNMDDLPVVQVTWEQAALFCNWLSRNASLPPAYVKVNNKIEAAEPMTTGFRLPTEAEWEYCARYNGSRATLRYAWGDRFPPLKNAGNFADVSAKDLLPNIITGYNDGYPATAPSGKFRAGALGLFDMGGNVAEWCHDYYAIHSAGTRTVATDPVGPKTGKFRVIRGASWKDADIGSLRLSYRDYDSTKRDDLGFRICRYAD